MVGGALGAKIGSFSASMTGFSNSLQWTETGMIIGVLLGSLIGVSIQVAMNYSSPRDQRTYSKSDTSLSRA